MVKIEKIIYKNELLGMKIKDISHGSIPITDAKEPLQLVTLKHPKGAYLKAHMHAPKKRVTASLQECLIVKKGRIKLDLYGHDKEFHKCLYMNPGEIFVLAKGGYGIKLMEDSELIELKNGPFVEDKILI